MEYLLDIIKIVIPALLNHKKNCHSERSEESLAFNQ